MNKLINYAILIYIIFSGIIATLFAIDYFVIEPMLKSEIASYYMYALSGMGSILNSHLNTTEQTIILDKLFNQLQIPSSITNNFISFNQFIGYESLFIVPPFILLFLMAYASKNNEKNHDD